MKRTSFITGAIILTLTNFIVRLSGFIFRIYLSRLLGPEGIGIYQLVLPIYVFLLTLASAGISVTVSRYVAEEWSKDKSSGIKRIILNSVVVVTIWNIILSVVTYYSIADLSNYVLKDERTYLALLVSIPCLFIVGYSSILRGFFYGMQSSTIPALAQIIEQMLKIIIVLLAIPYISHLGIEYSIALIVAAMVIGEMAGLVILYFSYVRNKKKVFKNSSTKPKKRAINPGIIAKILSMTIPVSVSGLIRTGMQSLNAILIPHRLVAAGYNTTEAISIFGKVSGMALPLIFFPSIIISALCVTLIPAISEAAPLKNYALIAKRITQAVKITLLVSLLTCCLYLTLSHPIAQIIYNSRQVGDMLLSLAVGSVFVYLQFTLTSILNGLGEQKVALKYSVISSGITLLCVFYLVSMPRLGIYGFSIGFFLSALVATIQSISFIKKKVGINIKVRNLIMKPLAISMAAALLSYVLHSIMSGYGINPWLCLASSVLAGIVLYLILLLMTKTVSISNFRKLLPF
ncbi:MAG: stage V sporulation protein B [Mahellales bacterium]|jgi:stage V sporulation protein B